MQDNHKTLAFILVAGMAALVAWEPWRPAPQSTAAPAEIGQKLFPEFKDPLAAKSLEVVTFNEANATLADFKVAQVNGVWSIPSHNNYPADAAEHMAQAANALLDLEIDNLASDRPGDRELFGVITPDLELRPGMVGVGMRVIVKGAGDKGLADLVIGKEVKDQPAYRYVRKPDNDQIYVAKVATNKFSTKFEDWIEKDLLKLNAFDVKQVDLNDYSTSDEVTGGGISLRVKNRSRIKLAFDDTKSSWSLVELDEFDPEGQAVPVKLAEGEELNQEKLNNMKTALDDLKIVDVQRKPKGLSQELKADESLVNDNEAALSLVQRGFFPVGENREIYSSEGEVTCTTKEGVRYVLRFGRLAGGEEVQEEAKAGDEQKSNPALNRYLFVMAQFDESQIAKPKFDPLPGEEPAAEAKPEGDKPAEEAKPADEKPGEEKPAEEAVPEQKTAQDETNPPAEEAEASKAEEPKADKPADDAAKAEDKPAAEEKKDAEPATPEEEKRVAVELANKRKQEEYDSAIKKGQDKVKELNERFADWYFIISDDVYQKVHLGRKEIVKEKDAKEPGTDVKGGLGELNGLPPALGK